MRQAGFLAAACLYAFGHPFQRLAEDHRNAERPAKRGILVQVEPKARQVTHLDVTTGDVDTFLAAVQDSFGL